MHKLYQAKNKNHNRILIIAKDEAESIDIALKLRFSKIVDNIQINDISDQYMNSERKTAGLNYDNLRTGQFFQIVNGHSSTWQTYMPE